MAIPTINELEVSDASERSNKPLPGMKQTRWLALAIAASSFIIIVLNLAILVSINRTGATQAVLFFQSRAPNIILCIMVTLLGTFLALLRPGNVYGWLWLIYGLSFSLFGFTEAYGNQALIFSPGSLPAGLPIAWISPVFWVIWITLMPFILLLFPNGRLPSRRWRWYAGSIVVMSALGTLSGLLVPGKMPIVTVDNPFGVPGRPGEILSMISNLAFACVILGAFLSIASLFFRFRSSKGQERQQMKWFVFATSLLGIYLLSSFFYHLAGAWDAILTIVPFLLLLVAIGIAVLKYRLYDIDLLINRTLVYGAMTLTLGAVYFGSVVLLQSAIRAIRGESGQLAIVVSTLLIAALFTPLRRRIQNDIDRRFYRKKYDAEQTLTEFSAKLRDEVDLDKLSAHLIAVVEETMQPEKISLWIINDYNKSENSIVVDALHQPGKARLHRKDG